MTDEKNCGGGCGGCDHDDDDRCDKDCDRECDETEETPEDNRTDNALTEHKRLSELYEKDMFAFEAEKQRLINDFIMSAPESQRGGLREFQKNWDESMKYAGSDKKRFELAQKMFREHVKNVFMPAVNNLADDTEEVVEELKDN